jgi:hypothetical protein
VTFTATVRPAIGTGTPSGTVQFNIDGTNVGGVLTLNAQGRASYATAALTAGNHNVTVVYSGSVTLAPAPAQRSSKRSTRPARRPS